MSETPILTLQPRRRYESRVEVRADEAKPNVYWFTISTERQASDGGILIADGMDASEFLKRPFVFHMHDATSIMGRCVDLKRSKEGWDASVELLPDDELKPDALHFVRVMRRYGLAAASIGFVVTDYDGSPDAKELAKYGATGGGWIGRKWKLREWSIVSIPADSGADMHAADPFMRIKDSHERRAVRATYALIGARSMMEVAKMGDETTTTNDAAGGVADTASSGTRADDMAAMMEQITAQNAAIMGELGSIKEMLTKMASEETTEKEEADGEPALEVEGEKSAKVNADWWARLAELQASTK